MILNGIAPTEGETITPVVSSGLPSRDPGVRSVESVARLLVLQYLSFSRNRG
jgi:hypothetical protein